MDAVTHPAPETPPLRNALEQFRAKTVRQKIHPQEIALLWIIGTQLVFLPWALGGMRVWSQWVSFGLSILAFVVSLKPRIYEDTSTGQAPFRLYTWPKLFRFPIFWLGLLFLIYIGIQAFNPAWVYRTDGKGWWMMAVPYREWLPSGVEVPFEHWGPWRMLLIYAGVWLTTCAAWIGFTRRRSLQTLFSILAGNAFLLALLGIAQRALDSDKMFFLWKPQQYYFVASFIYKNHAGAYFNLALALCAGLALWHFERAERRLDKSSPSGLFAFFGTAVAMIVFFSYSRTATILMAAFLLTMFGVFAWRHLFAAPEEKRNPWIILLLAIALVAFGRIGLISLGTERFVERMSALKQEAIDGGGANFRALAARATWDMALEKPTTGWGAGSFRFLFPQYQQHYSQIYVSGGKRLYWEHAHNDYAEFLAEFGIIGCSFLFLGFCYALIRTVRLEAWRNPLALSVLFGVALTAVHCWVDFNFYNPAVLTTWCVLLFSLLRWVELEELAVAG